MNASKTTPSGTTPVHVRSLRDAEVQHESDLGEIRR